jgi:hypothetical protein
MANNIIATDNDNFAVVFNVRLIMFDYFKKSWFCVYEQDEVYVVPPEKQYWDGKTFLLRESYEEDGKTFLIYHPEVDSFYLS